MKRRYLFDESSDYKFEEYKTENEPLEECALTMVQEFNLFNHKDDIPKELLITEDDIIKGNIFGKLDKIIKFYKDHGQEKKLPNMIQGIYYGIIGTTFGTQVRSANKAEETKYVPKVEKLTTYINKYCDDKAKNTIANDITNTIPACEKMIKEKIDPSNTILMNIYKDYLKDIKAALLKLK